MLWCCLCPSTMLGAAPKVSLPVALTKRILAACGAKIWLRQLLVCASGGPAVCWGRVCQESSVTLEMSASGSCDTCRGVGTALCCFLRCRSMCTGWTDHCFSVQGVNLCAGSQLQKKKGVGKRKDFAYCLNAKAIRNPFVC